jgi:TRAP transporter TAXI family solute receptor
MLKRVVSLLLVMVLVFSLTACGKKSEPTPDKKDEPAPQETLNLSWAATSQSSGFYPFNVAIADIINKNVEGVQVTVLETGGTADNLNMIEKGQAHFGQSSEPNLYEAQQGIGLYEGKGYEKPRLLFLANPLAYYFTVSEESRITSLSGLSGKKYNPGLQGSSTEILSYDILKEILGYTPEFVPGSTGEAVNAMKDRRIIGFTKSGPTNSPDSSLQDVSTSLKIRVLSFTDDEIAKVKEKYPYFQFVDVDGELYKQDGKITSIGLLFGPMVSADLPEDLVYNIVKAVFENQDYIEQAYGGVKGVDMVDLTANYSVSFLHPGTIKYLKEKGYTIDDSRIPPEMK